MTEADDPPSPPTDATTIPIDTTAPIEIPSPRPPGALEIVGRGIDLNVSLTREIRRMSLFIGGLFLAAIGPIAAIVIVRSIRIGGFEWLIGPLTGFGGLTPGARAGLGPLAAIALFFGIVCLVAISVDVQLMATALLGGRVGGRTLGLRRVIGIARQGFWRLIFASFFVGVILLVPRQVLGVVLLRSSSNEVRLLVATAIDLLLSAPFAYVGAAVVLAAASPFAAVRLSWQMARRRWRLAFVIGIVNTAVSYLATFAIGVGLDILVRVGTALGIDRGLGTVQSIELALIVAFAIVAIGSLTFTIAALTVAPQVIAWLGLGGPSTGLADADPANPVAAVRRGRLVTVPMQFAFTLSTVCAVVWIAGRA